MLQDNPLVTDVMFSPEAGLATKRSRRDKILTRIKRDWQMTVPQDVLAFYDEMNGCEIRWESTAPSPYAHHSTSHLESLEVLFGGIKGLRTRKWRPEVFEGSFFYQPWQVEAGEELSLQRRCKLVESIEGVSSEIGVVFEEDGRSTSLYVYDKLDPYRMSIDLPTYLEYHCKLLGYSYWYYVFLEAPESWHMNSLHLGTVFKLFPDMEPVLSARAHEINFPIQLS